MVEEGHRNTVYGFVFQEVHESFAFGHNLSPLFNFI